MFFVPTVLFGPRGPKLSYIGSATVTTRGTSFSFGNFTFPSDGLAIIGIAAGNNISGRTVSSATIAGSAVTMHESGAVGTNYCTFIGSLSVSAGSKAIACSMSGSSSSATVSVWLLTGNKSDTPNDHASASGTSTSLTDTFDIPANGVAVYLSVRGGASASWSSATMRNNLSAAGDTTTTYSSAADIATASALSSHGETVSWGSSSASCVSGVSWS